MSSGDLAEAVWRAMASLVIDNRDGWKRTVIEETGLPFSRIRILKRLSARPMTVKQVAPVLFASSLDQAHRETSLSGAHLI